MNRSSGEVAKALRVRQTAVRSVPVMATLRKPNSRARDPTMTPVNLHTTMKALKMTATVVEEARQSSSCRENRIPKDGDSIGTTNCNNTGKG